MWAGGGSSRQPGRATSRHSAMLASTRLPPPREPTCWLGLQARSSVPAVAVGRRSPGRACGLFGARLARALLVLAGAARSGRRRLISWAAAVPSPFLKGQRQAAASARVGRLGGTDGFRLGSRAGRPLPPHVLQAVDRGQHSPAAAGGPFKNRLSSRPGPSSRTRAASCGPRRGPRLCQTPFRVSGVLCS